MGKKLYVGNLGDYVVADDLDGLFAPHGTVQSAQVIEDHASGRSRGFGFVEMGSDKEAAQAIAALDGEELDGRAMTVSQAKPWEPRTSLGGYGRRLARCVTAGRTLRAESAANDEESDGSRERASTARRRW